MQPSTQLASICYPRNFLTQVIARVDFVSPVSQINKELPKRIAKAALQWFPIDEPQPIVKQEVRLSNGEVQTKNQKATVWNFFGREREKQLTITQDALFVSYTNYRRYDALREEFSTVLGPFFEACEEAQPSRLGLRFINELNIPGPDPLDWSEYVDPRLLGLLSYELPGASFSRIFHNLEAVFADFNLRLQFGIHNPDYPAPIRKRVFILDYDAYFKGLLEPQDVSESLDAFHAAIQALFEANISDKTREVLNAPG